MPPQTTHLDQRAETPVTHLDLPQCQIRYAYARSAESRLSDENGQDGLTFSIGENYLCFALCDGVSMSFLGDLASRFLCQALVDWLPTLPEKSSQPDLEGSFTHFLAGLTGPATALVDREVLPAGLSPLLVSVLEEKRRLGSESMFICGLLNFQKDCLTLAWMGDSRLEIWPERYEFSRNSYRQAFQTHERWSSRKGVIGQVHLRQSPLSSIQRLDVFSDGLAVLDRKMSTPYSDEQLNEIMRSTGETPTSDDLSLFEVQLTSSGE